MLTGKLPLDARAPYGLGMVIMTRQYSELPMDVPSGLQGIVRRYLSAVEVFNDLQSEFIGFQVRGILADHPYSEDRWDWRALWKSVVL